MARCGDCSRFVALETSGEPEVSDEACDERGAVSCDARIVDVCAECGSEIREATLELTGDSEEASEHFGAVERSNPDDPYALDAHEVTLDVVESERSVRTEKSRKVYYVVRATLALTCACGAELGTVELSDEIPASELEPV